MLAQIDRLCILLACATLPACAADPPDVAESTSATNNAAGAWFRVTFDNLATGPLAPRGGWSLWDRDNAEAFSYDDSNAPPPPVDINLVGDPNVHYLKCKAPLGRFEAVTKTVINTQSSGPQFFHFWARGNLELPPEATSATKVMVEGSSGKLFQIYIGSQGIRVNSGTAQTALEAPSVPNDSNYNGVFHLGVWYLVFCTFSLDADRQLSCLLSDGNNHDGTPANLTMPPSNMTGNLTNISIFSWPYTGVGAVTIDEMYGSTQ
jgi:hypothetical protein